MSAPVIATAVDPSTGRLVVPADPTTIGWYRYGPTPGQPGSALLAGHVDHDNRPGVFYALQDVAIGSLVDVAFADGSVTHFRVATVQLVDKTDIALNELFARSGSPRLTLVTCGGLFDWTHRTYRSNVIVSADPAPEA
jgi:LPXTG-site transpeptidase (sortase) family protein